MNKNFYHKIKKFIDVLQHDFFYGLRIGSGYLLSYILPFIPKLDTEPFENYIRLLVRNQINTDPDTRTIIDSLTDEQIIYKKGEGPELVFKRNNGSLIPRVGAILMCKYFIAKRFLLLKKCLSAEEIKNLTFLDVGATSGLFLRFLGKKGVGLNISPRAVEHTRKHGVESYIGSADHLPFGDKSFDYTLCFQTVEHLENPLLALRELKRVSRKGIFLTIPYVKDTAVCDTVIPERGMHRWHVFEFSPSDFKKILERVGLKIVMEERIRVIGKPRTIPQFLFYLAWGWGSWFEGFIFYKLEAAKELIISQ